MIDWKNTTIAPDGSHHLYRGTSFYEDRFDSVMKYHDPGLAPVYGDDESWHIDVHGKPAYRERYRRVFGFYEGLAANEDRDGWAHMRTDGTAAYDTRYEWCGNFQDGLCTVRLANGLYRHIHKNGEPAYENLWNYAGDFRDGIAVVQRDDGLSSHIDAEGRLLHTKWFLDLDVFHKGYARAKDQDGWGHIDVQGRPAYSLRYQMIEPFYNGQARVERHDGGIEIIDENGDRLMEVRPARRSAFAELSDDMVGFWKTETIAAAIKLKILEALPGSLEEIASDCGLPSRKLNRILKALAEMGIARKNSMKSQWELTAKGRLLKHDHPKTLADAALEYAGPLQQAWKQIPEALLRENYCPPDIFRAVAEDEQRRHIHHRMLRSYALHDYEKLVPFLPIRHGDRVVDAGGGSGILAEMIKNHFNDIQLTVFDLPEVARLVDEDIQSIGGDFFKKWSIQADVIILARVLHDWNDDKALLILKNARNALSPGGRLVVVEMMVSESGYNGSLCDLHLLVGSGGTQRTREQFRRLLEEAGFDPSFILETHSPALVIGVPI